MVGMQIGFQQGRKVKLIEFNKTQEEADNYARSCQEMIGH